MTVVTRRSSSADEGDRHRPSRRSALDFALARLARRAHSEGELAAKLGRAGYDEREIATVLSHLRARRYLDDLSFARGFARSAREHKHWGPTRIAQRLRQRGLSDAHIGQALAEAFPGGEAEPAARALERFRRMDRRRGGTAQERKARAYRHLYARGFSPEAIHEALASLTDNRPS